MERHQRGSYTDMVRLHPVAFASGKGVVLTDVDGNEYIDFSSGIVVTNLGHAHPDLVAILSRQAAELQNVHDFATSAKVDAMERLAAVTPRGMTLIQFFSAGTEAVEAALRIARAATGRNAFIGVENDYHGRTTGAAALSTVMAWNGPRPPETTLVPNGHCYHCSYGLDFPTCELRCTRIFEDVQDDVAAFVVEPITNAGGGTVPRAEYLPAIAEECHERGALLVADEVASGCGRTGAWFACDHWDVVPDVLTIGKGLGNGFPVSAIAVREELEEAFRTFFPSTTYGGNPMAAAVAAETLRILDKEKIIDHCRSLGEFALARLEELRERHPIVGEIRGRGALLGIELVKDRETKEPYPEAGNLVYQKAFQKGVAWATAGHILRITPPIVMTPEIFAKGLEIVEEAITETEHELCK